MYTEIFAQQDSIVELATLLITKKQKIYGRVMCLVRYFAESIQNYTLYSLIKSVLKIFERSSSNQLFNYTVSVGNDFF